MRRHRKGKLRPDLDMIPLSTRHLGQSGCAKTCIRVKRLVKTNKRPFCRCRGMGRWDHQRELLTGRWLAAVAALRGQLIFECLDPCPQLGDLRLLLVHERIQTLNQRNDRLWALVVDSSDLFMG